MVKKKGMGVGKKSASRCAVHAIKGLCVCACVCVWVSLCVSVGAFSKPGYANAVCVCVCVCGFIARVVFFITWPVCVRVYVCVCGVDFGHS